MADNKISPRDAAIAVLQKAEQMYKESSLAKGEWKKIHDKLEREGYSKESADKIDGSIKAKLGKAENPMQKMGMSEQNPDEKADAKLGEEVEQDVQQHEENNEDPKHAEPKMKGHIKLAKFMGRMEHKKGMKAMDKGDDMMPPQAPNMSGQSQPAAAPMKMSMSEKK